VGEEPERVEGTTVSASFEVQVRPPGVPGATDLGDRLALSDPITGVDHQSAGMGIKGGKARAMIDEDGLPVPALLSGQEDPAGCSGPDRPAEIPVDVDALVASFPSSSAESGGDPSLERPGKDGGVARGHPYRPRRSRDEDRRVGRNRSGIADSIGAQKGRDRNLIRPREG